MLKLLLAASVTGLAAVGIVGLARPGRDAACEGVRPALTEEAVATEAALAPETSESMRADRIALPGTSGEPHAPDADDVATVDGHPRPGTEAWYLARYLASADPEHGALEESARQLLAGNGPDCEKVAVLRALCTAGSAQAFEILSTTVEDHADVSRAQGESVPRCALRFLAEHAAKDAGARAALTHLAWNEGKTIDSALRASAAASLALVASGTEALPFVRRLQIERDPLVHAAALEALSRNPDPNAAAAFRSLDVETAANAITDGDG